MKVKKSTDMKRKIPTVIALCIGVSLCLMFISVMLISTLILKEKVSMDAVDYLCKSTLAIVTFLGVKFSIILSPDEYVPSALMYTGAILVIHFIVGVCLGSSIVRVLLNTMFIVCGSGSALLIGNKKKKKNIKIKKRYR